MKSGEGLAVRSEHRGYCSYVRWLQLVVFGQDRQDEKMSESLLMPDPF